MSEIESWHILLAVIYGSGMIGFSNRILKHFPEDNTLFEKSCQLLLLAMTTIFWLPICLFMFPIALYKERKSQRKGKSNGNKD